jgi:hypothetical protein
VCPTSPPCLQLPECPINTGWQQQVMTSSDLLFSCYALVCERFTPGMGRVVFIVTAASTQTQESSRYLRLLPLIWSSEAWNTCSCVPSSASRLVGSVEKSPLQKGHASTLGLNMCFVSHTHYIILYVNMRLIKNKMIPMFRSQMSHSETTWIANKLILKTTEM